MTPKSSDNLDYGKLLSFDKMQGIGNDFVVTHLVAAGAVDKIASVAKQLCDRRFGIGADGIIFVLPSEIYDFKMRIINSDGSEAEMCGNGIRCFACYVYNHGLSDSPELTIETKAGLIKTQKTADETIMVTMSVPVLDAPKIPVAKNNGTVINEPVTFGDSSFAITAVSMGNPHAVIFADHLSDALVETYGPLIEKHPFFPKRTNVEFVKVLSDNEIEMRVFERGCGETLACGTGACAAVVAGILNKKLSTHVTVYLLGGVLSIAWTGNLSSPVYMSGKARFVYRGEVEIPL